MLRGVALVTTDVSEELSASFIRVTSSSELSVLTRATWRNIPEDTILHSHHGENLKSYIENNIKSYIENNTLETDPVYKMLFSSSLNSR
jgi:hypothetical protein